MEPTHLHYHPYDLGTCIQSGTDACTSRERLQGVSEYKNIKQRLGPLALASMLTALPEAGERLKQLPLPPPPKKRATAAVNEKQK